MDAAHLNRVANDPTVRPMLGGIGDLDVQGLLSTPSNIALENEHGGFIFVCDDAGRYELHTMFLPSGRGAAVLAAVSEALRFMFTATDCGEVITKVPRANRAAAFMARRAGFRLMFRRDGAWSDGTAVEYFSMTLDDWRGLDPAVEPEGHAFHVMIEGAKARCGSELPTHADDPAHDRAAGAASLMARAGNPTKAVWSYNRWARFAGYQTIELLSVCPPLIDVRDALVTTRDGKLEVLQCR